MAEFEPDPQGNNINVEANVVIVEKSIRGTKRIETELLRKQFHKDCGCPSCNQRLMDLADDNLDMANWMVGEGKWDNRVTVTEKPKKRRR